MKNAKRRNSHLKKISKESHKTLMMYAKKTNVLAQFEKQLKEDTREVSEDDAVVME